MLYLSITFDFNVEVIFLHWKCLKIPFKKQNRGTTSLYIGRPGQGQSGLGTTFLKL